MLPDYINRILFGMIPLLLLTLFFGAEEFLAHWQKIAFYSEYGIELFQEVLLFVCVFLSLWIFEKLKPSENKWSKIWIALCAFACFYIAFEEISWGQKFLFWDTPEQWSKGVSQKETNIHNQSQLFNRVPRSILEIGILIGGVVIPIIMKWWPEKLPERFTAIYPLKSIFLIGSLAFLIKILEQFPSWFDIKIFYRKSEVMEMFMYYFIFLYLISIAQKWSFEGRLK